MLRTLLPSLSTGTQFCTSTDLSLITSLMYTSALIVSQSHLLMSHLWVQTTSFCSAQCLPQLPILLLLRRRRGHLVMLCDLLKWVCCDGVVVWFIIGVRKQRVKKGISGGTRAIWVGNKIGHLDKGTQILLWSLTNTF